MHGDDDHADRGRDGEPTGGDLGLEPGAGDLRVIDREDGRDDRADHRRVGPVVHRPGRSSGRLRPRASRARGSHGLPIVGPRSSTARSCIASLLHRAASQSMILEATKPVPPATSPCPAGFFPGHSGQRSICTRKPPSLTRADSRSRRPSSSDSRCQESSSSQPRISRGMRRSASTNVLKTLPGWRRAR